MAFLGGLKRALGWSDGEDDEDYISMDSSSPEKDTQPYAKKDTEIKMQTPEDIPDGLFDGLIEIINANLSPMVLKCLDVEAEKKYLYEALGSKFFEFVKTVKEQGVAVARADWDKEKAALDARIGEFKSRCEAAETERNEIKAQKMSEDRQKAALKERVRTLEDKLATAEAEKEQYDLENKSLLNKLKVAQVKTDAVEVAEAEVRDLTAQIVELKRKMADGSAVDERVKQLEEEYNAKMEISNALLNELRAEAVRNKELFEEKVFELSSLQEKLTEKDTVIDNVGAELKTSNEALSKIQIELEAAKVALDEKTAEIDEMSENLSVLDSIQEQLDKVEDFKKKKDEEIAALGEKCAEYKQKVAELQELYDKEQAKCAELQAGAISLERALDDCNDKVMALSQENADTLDLLHNREGVLAAQKSEIEELKQACESSEVALNEAKAHIEALKTAHESDINALKSADVEKTKKFQAEIAELQAKLNVNGKIDDLLTDEGLRQAVDETFDISIDESALSTFELDYDAKEDAFDVSESEKMTEMAASGEIVEMESNFSGDGKEITFDAGFDDIDWLLPDAGNKIVKEEPKEEQEMPALPANDMQMSLFG